MANLVKHTDDPLAQLMKTARRSVGLETKPPRWWHISQTLAKGSMLCRKHDCRTVHVSTKMVLRSLLFLCVACGGPWIIVHTLPCTLLTVALLAVNGLGGIIASILNIQYTDAQNAFHVHVEKHTLTDERALLAKYLNDELEKMRAALVGEGSDLLKLRQRYEQQINAARKLAEQGRDLIGLKHDDPGRAKRIESLASEARQALRRLMSAKGRLDAHIAKTNVLIDACKTRAELQLTGSFDELEYARQVKEVAGEASEAVQAAETAIAASMTQLQVQLIDLRGRVLPAFSAAASKLFGNTDESNLDASFGALERVLEQTESRLLEGVIETSP